MGSQASKRLSWESVFGVAPEDRQKLLFLSVIFFLIIAGYTLAKDLKDAVFISIIGESYAPVAKLVSMVGLVLPMVCYSWLVDRMRRCQLLSLCGAFFGVAGLLFAYYIGHPTIGIVNTNASADRWFGWLFYCFVEGYSPFLVSVFWAFANSVSSPDSARKTYGFMVAGSKLGGCVAAGFAWTLFYTMSFFPVSASYDTKMIQLVFVASSLCLLMVPFAVALFMRRVPGRYLHGYEAAYQFEKQRKKEKESRPSVTNDESFWGWCKRPLRGLVSGLDLFIKYPYVLGIFSMVFFFEVISTVIGYLRLGEANKQLTLASKCSYLFGTIFITHLIALVISVVGTRPLLERLGERVCLLMAPVITGLIVLSYMIAPWSLVFSYSALRSINFAFFWPVRESLYIPTVKEIKFKSKAWIDGIGSKLSKGSGSLFNMLFVTARSVPVPILAAFCAPLIIVWCWSAYLLGRRFDQAVARGEVIGGDEVANSSESGV